MREPLGIAWAFKTSKSVHSDTPPPIRAILIHITTPSLTKVTNYFFTGKRKFWIGKAAKDPDKLELGVSV